MPYTAIKFGRVLVLIGIIGYAFGYYNGYASPTALIPAVFGAVLMILGYVARAKDNLRKHLMHVAVIIGLLGFLASAGRLLSKITEISMSAAVVSQIAMAAVCLIFVLVCVKSFMNARSND